jgi:fatty-acyl-CoA synthase
MLHKFLNLQAKIVDQDGRMVPVGSKGELWVRGYSVMPGYWDDEQKTREFIGLDGWTKTG